MDARVKVGILGCGNILPQYVKGCRAFGLLEVVACADIDLSRARARAEEFYIPKACTPEELLADPEIQLIVNLTVPKAHVETNLAAIEAGKSVHAEKPFALKREDGQRILAAAEARGVRVGCAPDTFLGGGLQTCRKLIDEGWIGQPVAAAAFMAGHGPEAWHPNPDFFYQFGGGPLFDMGPYYITALVSLLGAVRRVTASARISFPERIATSQALFGRRIGVEVPTHVAGVLDFESGVVATMVMSFDVWAHNLPRIEIYGSEGSLSVPDPNTFGGPVQVRRAGAETWSDIPLTHSAEVGRGIGAADMAYGLVYGRPHRASGQLANHVLDVMVSLYDASESGAHVMVQSRVERPAPLPLGLLPGTLDR
ncbi:MAG: gfo/Idh/MocA family oxidoreductase [Chloroflexi bacterium]|nr:gfo/Idh/MocA family oxidoreductase [Chloroflexota bacterium]MDL1884226.1 Gfo/Idh/MocA family oxidoreductase [Anaerolineae bacterium CFX8]